MVYNRFGKENVYTYGPIIHNEIVVDDLKEQGVDVLEEGKDLDSYQKGTIVIRSHGVSKNTMDELRSHNFRVVDATCRGKRLRGC